MLNPRNFGTVEGRLARDPQFKDNADGSVTVLLTVAVKDNFDSKLPDGSRAKETQFIPLQAFISRDRAARRKESLDNGGYGTAFDIMKKGDVEQFMYSVRQDSYVDANNITQYRTYLVIEQTDLKGDLVGRRAEQPQAKPEAEIEADEFADVPDMI